MMYHSRMRIEPEKMLKKHGIAAIGFHEERLTHGSLTKVAPLDVPKRVSFATSPECR
jgi:hypothetical protein